MAEEVKWAEEDYQDFVDDLPRDEDDPDDVIFDCEEYSITPPID